MRLFLTACLALVCFVGLGSFSYVPEAAAQLRGSSPQVVSIEVRGNARVETDAIINAMDSEVGDRVDLNAVGDDIRNIYELGFFEDIVIYARDERGGITLIVEVEEKPTIRAIVFEGNDDQDDEDLSEKVRSEVDQILDESRVAADARAIQAFYEEEGYYLAEVEHELRDVEDGQVDVVFIVREFDKIRVGGVSFIGNDQIPDDELQGVLETRPQGYLSFLTKFGSFNQSSFSDDLQRIRAYYYEKGFLDVEVGEPLVELSADRTQIYLTIPVEEGEPYDIGDIRIGGELLEEPAEMMRFVQTEVGDRFASSAVRGDVQRLETHFKDLGYAFATVQIQTQVDEDDLTVDVSYTVRRGEPASIGRIEIVGNTITRDRVIRREMVIEEGDDYSTTDIQRSVRFIQRLGFFENVEIREERSSVDDSLVDLQIEVTERPTRTLQVGAGFSSFDGFIANAQISENNLFGRGQSLSFNLNWSRRTRNFEISFLEPRLGGSRWQLSTSLYSRRYEYIQFRREALGGSLSVGYLLTRELTLTLGWRAERVGAFPRNDDVFISSLFAQGNQLSIGPTAGLYYDSRDDRLFPTGGMYHGLRAELSDSVFGAEQNYLKMRLFTRFYWEPFWDNWVIRFNGELGRIYSTRGGQEAPITERFFLGGAQSIRGFDNFSLSPCENRARTSDPGAATVCDEIGGYKSLHFNLELEFPVVQSFGLRGVVFVDAGNAYGLRDRFSFRPDFTVDRESRSDRYGNVLRTSAGFGFRWRSPIGPLRFEWGFPLARIRGEEAPVRFEFGIGNLF